MCVYDLNYALIIVTQPKKEEWATYFTKKNQCSFSVKYTNPILSWYEQFCGTQILDGARVLLCVCMTKIMLF